MKLKLKTLSLASLMAVAVMACDSDSADSNVKRLNESSAAELNEDQEQAVQAAAQLLENTGSQWYSVLLTMYFYDPDDPAQEQMSLKQIALARDLLGDDAFDGTSLVADATPYTLTKNECGTFTRMGVASGEIPDIGSAEDILSYNVQVDGEIEANIEGCPGSFVRPFDPDVEYSITGSLEESVNVNFPEFGSQTDLITGSITTTHSGSLVLIDSNDADGVEVRIEFVNVQVELPLESERLRAEDYAQKLLSEGTCQGQFIISSGDDELTFDCDEILNIAFNHLAAN